MYDLVIVGGGLWGTAAALSAVEHRFGRVLLLEQNAFAAGESSAKAGGIVSDFVAHTDDQAWVTKSREFFRRAQAASGDHTMIQENGMLSLCTPAQAEQLAVQVQQLKMRNIPVELWDSHTVTTRWSDLDRVPADIIGIWTPQDWHVNPTAAANAFLALARSMGLDVRLDCRVATILPEPHRVIVRTRDELIPAARVLVTAGTWTRKLLQTAGIDIPFRPYRTQLASLAFPGLYRLPIVRELATDMYFVPDGAHNLLVGDGTRLWEHDPDDYETLGDRTFIRTWPVV
jgi:sarcosine oxidase subunit beta